MRAGSMSCCSVVKNSMNACRRLALPVIRLVQWFLFSRVTTLLVEGERKNVCESASEGETGCEGEIVCESVGETKCVRVCAV